MNQKLQIWFLRPKIGRRPFSTQFELFEDRKYDLMNHPNYNIL